MKSPLPRAALVLVVAQERHYGRKKNGETSQSYRDGIIICEEIMPSRLDSKKRLSGFYLP